jgi:predicted transcriptional regulator
MRARGCSTKSHACARVSVPVAGDFRLAGKKKRRAWRLAPGFFALVSVVYLNENRPQPSQGSIARELGLSQATVSNALTGKRYMCSPENYRRVRDYAMAVGYTATKRLKHSQSTIARDLRLSQSSVSNALAGKRDMCSPENFERVWAYAEQVGYRTRPRATSETFPSRTLPLPIESRHARDHVTQLAG